MGDSIARGLQDRYVRAMNTRDWDALAELLHPDYVEEWPQSGERIRGFANFRSIVENYPGQPRGQEVDVESLRVFESPEQWVMTPTFTTVRVTGNDDVFMAVIRTVYPDQSVWHMVSIAEVRDGRFARSWRYWAPEYPAPEWRSQWVEPIRDAPADQRRG